MSRASKIDRVLRWLFPDPPLGQIPNWRPVESIPLKTAIFCADCGQISESRNGCPICGSHAIEPVETLIQKGGSNAHELESR